MKRITKIELTNYKGFYGSNKENTVEIPFNKNVLIYGENGSGKSSLHEGLRQFFNSSAVPSLEIPARNLDVNERDTNGNFTEVSVKITFTDQNNQHEQRIFGRPISNTSGAPFIQKANLLNSFLSYRELLRTYLIEDLKNRKQFVAKFAHLLIDSILAYKINPFTTTRYIDFWASIHASYARNRDGRLKNFNLGLESDISDINIVINELLNYFHADLKVELKLLKSKIEHGHSTKNGKSGNFPKCEVDINVWLRGKKISDSSENHLTVLNEARLSSLAISIYLAGIVITPQDTIDYKILFLDDIFIGLDMSNRLPLLKILSEFRKPIVRPVVTNQATGEFVNKILEIDGKKQYEPTAFFNNHQIFITTYDRNWFNVAKNYLDMATPDKWNKQEIYSGRTSDGTNAIPIVFSSIDDLGKAELYLQRHEYEASANFLRKALEKRLKELLPQNCQYTEELDKESNVKVVRKIKQLSQFIDRYIAFCGEIGIDVRELRELKNFKDWYFNPLSHDNIGTPIFRLELERAKKLVIQLYSVNHRVIVEAGKDLMFLFINDLGEYRDYRVQLKENLRYINTSSQIAITNPQIICYQWDQNGITRAGNWPGRLKSFYNNKSKAFFKVDVSEDINYLEEFRLVGGARISALVE